jgi:AcrR family transcriptional regulator
MSATEPRPQRADARRNRERIMDAAREVFAEYGQDAQMDDVAKRAGVGVGTVYRHFPTKDALAGEILAAKLRNHAEAARRWSAEAPDAWTAFEGLLRESFAAMAADAQQQRMMFVASDAAMAHAEPARLELVDVMGALIDRARAEGRLRDDFTIDEMPALMCAVGGVMSAPPDRVPGWDRVVDVLIDGLRARP